MQCKCLCDLPSPSTYQVRCQVPECNFLTSYECDRRKRAIKCITVFVQRESALATSNRRVVCRVGLWRQFSAPTVTCYRNRRECEWCNRCCYWKIKYAAIQKPRKKAELWGECDLTSFKLCKNQESQRSLLRLFVKRVIFGGVFPSKISTLH